MELRAARPTRKGAEYPPAETLLSTDSHCALLQPGGYPATKPGRRPAGGNLVSTEMTKKAAGAWLAAATYSAVIQAKSNPDVMLARRPGFVWMNTRPRHGLASDGLCYYGAARPNNRKAAPCPVDCANLPSQVTIGASSNSARATYAAS